ncbi:hypothetical protein BGZ58_007547 [Dissophora ornata]|nr:hypothetical protein BGZ58_007547 [Dissophora ornata]
MSDGILHDPVSDERTRKEKEIKRAEESLKTAKMQLDKHVPMTDNQVSPEMKEILDYISEAQSRVKLLTKLTEDPDPENECAFESEDVDSPWQRALFEMSSVIECQHSSDASSLDLGETRTEPNSNTTTNMVTTASNGVYSDDANPRQLKREYAKQLAKMLLVEAEKDLEKHMKAYEMLVATE